MSNSSIKYLVELLEWEGRMPHKLKYVDVDGAKYGYAHFDTSETGFEKMTCVFSTAERKGRSSINAAESIINEICSKERMHWGNHIFCDLQTGRGYPIEWPEGFYQFDMLRIGNEPRQFDRRPGACHCIDAWIPTECPATVFHAFSHLIGSFPTIDKLYGPSPWGKWTEEELAERKWGLAAAQREQQSLQKHYEQVRKKYGEQLYTPEQALEMGYHFVPCGSPVSDPDWSQKPEGAGRVILVDMTHSHLRGQYVRTICSEAFLRTPLQFAYWTEKKYKERKAA